MERVMGIEPTYSAWKADVLPLNYTRIVWVIPVVDGKARYAGMYCIDSRRFNAAHPLGAARLRLRRPILSKSKIVSLEG